MKFGTPMRILLYRTRIVGRDDVVEQRFAGDRSTALLRSRPGITGSILTSRSESCKRLPWERHDKDCVSLDP